MNAWLMKGYFDTVPMSLDESAKLDGAGHFRRFWQIVLPLVRPMVAVQALWAFMGPFETISSLVSCFVRKNTLQLPLVSKPSSTMRRTWRLPTSQQVLSSSPFQSVFSSSSYKRTLFQDLQVVATRDNLSPPPFFILYSSKISSNHVSFISNLKAVLWATCG